MAEPIPVFHPESVKTAVAFARQMGGLKRLRQPPKTPPSRAPEIAYFRRLNRMLQQLQRLVREIVVARLPEIVAESPTEFRARQDQGEILDKAFGDLRLAFAAEAPIEMVARATANDAEARNAREQKRVVQTVLGVRPELQEPWLQRSIDDFAKENTQLISNVTEDFIDRVERRVGKGVREGVRAEDLAKAIEKDFIRKNGLEATKARKRAKLIARDQVGSIQGEITKVRQQNIGVTKYIWRTANDERVRPSHEDRDGLQFDWGRPIEDQLGEYGLQPDTVDGHPGTPINCRCYGEPVLSDLIEGLPEI